MPCWPQIGPEAGRRAESIKKLRPATNQIEGRIEIMYMDSLMAASARPLRQGRHVDARGARWLLRKIQGMRRPRQPVDHAVDMLGLKSASELFLQQAAEQRRLLQTVMEKGVMEDGKLQIALFEPFSEILRHSNQESIERKRKRPLGRDMGFGS